MTPLKTNKGQVSLVELAGTELLYTTYVAVSRWQISRWGLEMVRSERATHSPSMLWLWRRVSELVWAKRKLSLKALAAFMNSACEVLLSSAKNPGNERWIRPASTYFDFTSCSQNLTQNVFKLRSTVKGEHRNCMLLLDGSDSNSPTTLASWSAINFSKSASALSGTEAGPACFFRKLTIPSTVIEGEAEERCWEGRRERWEKTKIWPGFDRNK